MSHVYKHPIPASVAERTLITPEKYQQFYQQSVEDPDAFWARLRVPSSNQRISIFPGANDVFFTFVKGLIQSNTFACSAQNASGSSTDC